MSGIVCQDETEEIADEHDLDNDADELDDDDVGEVLPEHFGDDLDIETKEKEINQVTLWCGKLWAMLSNSSMFLEVFILILWLIAQISIISRAGAIN